MREHRGAVVENVLAKLRETRILKFEWDEYKAALNIQKHGVAFDMATLVFHDPGRVEDIDDIVAYGEERLIATGMASGKILTVIYTARDENFRIISARKATRREQQNYYLKIGV